jgi:Flp pilus assembly protein TadD
MSEVRAELPAFDRSAPRLLVLRHGPGDGRRRKLAAWVAGAEAAGARAFLLRCDFDFDGPWAGARALVRALLPEVERDAPDLVERHARELATLLPHRCRGVEIPDLNLMDLTPPAERVRGYAMERAYRLAHGLVDWVAEWHRRQGDGRPWALACDGFEAGGTLGTAFVLELLRRRGAELGLTLLVTAERDGAAPEMPVGIGTIQVAGDEGTEENGPADPMDPDEAARRALALEGSSRNDVLAQQEAVPEILHLWLEAGRADRILFWRTIAFTHGYFHGFYEDALRYAEGILDRIDEALALAPHLTRWNLVGAIAYSDLAVDRPERALACVLCEGLARIDSLANRARISYVLAMIQARHLPRVDLAAAEGHLHEGLVALAAAEISEADRAFLQVFLGNGLAFVRHRQGRPQEALELCRSGFALLAERLPPERHRLHRSSLLYNMGQVHSATGSFAEAIECYGLAAEFDPNNSELYNERGNAWLALGQAETAIDDYRRAIRLSPPYPEVWTNLGQAARRIGRFDQAVEAYTRALDLAPEALLPRLGRAQALAALDRRSEAIADYTTALAATPGDPLALSNRAALHFLDGRSEDALADLDRAVELDPGNADLYYNRAAALERLGRREEMRSDLLGYLRLSPEGEERAEVVSRLAELGV